MIESAAYDLIKQEGFQQGKQQGQLTASRDALIDLLAERFEIVPQHILQTIQQIENLFVLKMAIKQTVKASSIENFYQILKRMMQ